MARARMSRSLLRRLEALERAVGAGESQDYGPAVLISITRYWRATDDAAAREGDGGGRRQEQACIAAAVAQLRAEARARRCLLGVVTARVTADGQVEFTGVPWLLDDLRAPTA